MVAVAAGTAAELICKSEKYFGSRVSGPFCPALELLRFTLNWSASSNIPAMRCTAPARASSSSVVGRIATQDRSVNPLSVVRHPFFLKRRLSPSVCLRSVIFCKAAWLKRIGGG